MTIRTITEGIYAIGAIDWDRQMFDELITLPQGTSYNAYVIRGSEKTALIDTVDPTKDECYVTNLVQMGLENVDYIIIQHAEQDHAGTLPLLLELFPKTPVLCSEKCKGLLISLLGVSPDRVRIVADDETVSLGDKTLRFMMTPWVHWPETMLTYCMEDEILFSCDLFGSHYATSDLFLSDTATTGILAKRYYAEIMMPFRSSITTYLARLGTIKIETIAPSHGPLIRPATWILDLYRKWTAEETKNSAVLLYVSMHGSTKEMARFLEEALIDNGVGVTVYNVATADSGMMAASLVDASTVIIATPTVLFGPHPAMVSAVYLANAIRPKIRYAAIIGSYGWGGKTVETIKGMLTHIKAEILDPVMKEGAPDEKTRQALLALATTIAEKHRTDPDIST
ncbi:MAG: FprA family A-type flavoprotein [Methanospirillaceae archaeon]|nr:FprA family A-type flavoprotein [Methanospirillaceae archaeon]